MNYAAKGAALTFVAFGLMKWQRRLREQREQLETNLRYGVYQLAAYNRTVKRLLISPDVDEMYFVGQYSADIWLEGKWPFTFMSHRYSLTRISPFLPGIKINSTPEQVLGNFLL